MFWLHIHWRQTMWIVVVAHIIGAQTCHIIKELWMTIATLQLATETGYGTQSELMLLDMWKRERERNASIQNAGCCISQHWCWLDCWCHFATIVVGGMNILFRSLSPFIHFSGFSSSFANTLASILLTLKWISDEVLLKHIICGIAISWCRIQIVTREIKSILYSLCCLSLSFFCIVVSHFFWMRFFSTKCSMNLKCIVHVHWISLDIIIVRANVSNDCTKILRTNV